MTADYADFQTPQAHATAIAATGAPLLALSNTLYQLNAVNIPGGSFSNSLSLPVTQIGYELRVEVNIAAGSTNPFLQIGLLWFSATGVTLASEQYMVGASTVTRNIYTITGPVKAEQVVVTLNNLDPAQAMTVTALLLQNSRVYNRDRIFTNSINDVPGFFIGTPNPLFNVLASFVAVSLNAGQSKSRLMPIYAGDIQLYVDQQGVGAANFAVQLQAAPVSFFGAASLWSGTATGGVGGTPAFTIMRLPRCHGLLTFTNNGTVTATVNATAVPLDEKF